jgi:hypothetical protein
MPVVERSNNRILPANARAADVAEKAVVEITPVQQRRYYDAFRVQGIECIHYSRMFSGLPCSCQSAGKQINGFLGEDGKASAGVVNSLITGAPPMEFNVTPYNHNQQRYVKDMSVTSPYAPVNKNQGVFDIAVTGTDTDIPFADLINGRGTGDNGPVESVTIDDMVGDFDASMLGFSDVSCPICFGTGFTGGFTPYHAHRQVLTVADVQVVNGELDLLERPLSATCTGINVITILPRGAIGCDVFRVWAGSNPQPAIFTIDGTTIANIPQLLGFCDGKPHVIGATGLTKFTHLEIQFTLSTESVYFEFPKRSSSNNIALLEQDDPFNVIMSPNLPHLQSMDVIVEQQRGKTLLVQNVNPWNTRNRNMLGWEAQVRVIQPQEMYRILPARGRTQVKNPTTNLVRDNVTGPRRT